MSDPQFVPEPFPVAPTSPLPPSYGTVPSRQDEYDTVPPRSQGQRVLDTFFAPSIRLPTSAAIGRGGCPTFCLCCSA